MAVIGGILLHRGRLWLGLLLAAMLLFPHASGQGEPLVFGSIRADSTAETVDMGDERIADWDAFLAFLGRFPNLRHVDLFATPVTGRRIELLRDAFPGVTFGMTMRIGDHAVRTDATAFSTLHMPSSQPHGDEELSLLRYCTGLRALDLGHNRLTDLSFLRDLPELRILILSMNELTDITPVGSLSHLEYLEMFGNRITDISCLEGLRFLTDLNLAENRIDSLDALEGLTGLRRLWIGRFNTRLDKAAVRDAADRLRALLPGCRVDAVSTGIGGGWREDPHYETVRRIFRSGVYEPFADSPEENR